MADDDAGTVDSNVAVFVRKGAIATLREGGEELRVGLVVEDSDAGDVVEPAVRNLSTAMTLAMVFVAPDGTRTTKPAVFADFGGATGDGTDGAIMATDVGFLTEGTWEVAAEVLLADGTRFATNPELLRVLEDIDPSFELLPETILAVHRVAWWRELHTVGNPGRLGTWRDMWQDGNLTAVSVAAGGGPAIVSADALFGGKTSFVYDELRLLESGVAADWTFLHDGSGCTVWLDAYPTDAGEEDVLFGTFTVATFAGLRLLYNGPSQRFRLEIGNADPGGALLHSVVFGEPFAASQRARIAFDWCYDDPSGIDLRVFLNGTLAAEVGTDYPGAPSSAAPQDTMHVGNGPSGGGQYAGRLAELGFVRGCIAPEVAGYLDGQP